MINKTTILVTTDFSTNSKAGIRFAIQYASQTPCKLVFYHTLETLTPTMWRKEDAAQYAQTEIAKSKAALVQFIKPLLKQAAMPIDDEYVVEMGLNVDNFIIDYAKSIHADYICMCTRGAGVLKKLIGTNASTLVDKSPIPVIVVPHNYRINPLTKVGYASDFENLDNEMTKVQAFTAALNAKLDVYHYDYAFHNHYAFNEQNKHERFKDIIDKYSSEDTTFHIPELFIDYSLVENLQKMITKEKPSILVMFTKQKDNWFERFFFESKTSAMTFGINIPLLAIGK